jgi:hypothetical protein
MSHWSSGPLGISEEFMLAVARGQVRGHSIIHKFGRNESVGTAYEGMWIGSNVYVFPTAASAAIVVSDDANDTLLGTGARTLTIQGLDVDFEVIQDTIDLNGTTEVTTANSYFRVNRAFVDTGGTEEGAIGTVSISINGGTVALVAPTENKTLQAVYTVPANHSAFMYQLGASSAKNNELSARLRIRKQGKVFTTDDSLFVYGGHYIQNHPLPVALGEKVDIKMDAKIETTGGTAVGTFDILLIDDSA